MMIKRIFTLVSSVLLLAVLLTGCVRTEVGISLKSDGSGTVGTVVLIQSEAYEMMKASGDPFEGKETYTETIDDTEYTGSKSTAEYDSAEELKAALLDLTFAGNAAAMKNRISDTKPEIPSSEIILDETAEESDAAQGASIFNSAEIVSKGGKLTFRAALNPQRSENAEGVSGDMDINEMYKLKVIVTMPGKIESASAGTVEDSTVTWNVENIITENSIEIISNAGGSAVPMVIFVVLAVLCSGLIVLLIIKNKKKK